MQRCSCCQLSMQLLWHKQLASKQQLHTYLNDLADVLTRTHCAGVTSTFRSCPLSSVGSVPLFIC
jgi:hypothetical protein